MFITLPKFKKIQAKTDELNLVSRENLTGLRVVRAYNAEKFREEKFDATNKELAGTFLSVNRAMGLVFPFISFLMVGVGLANWWLGAFIMDGMGMEAGAQFFASLTAFTQYSIQIIISFMFLMFVLVQMPRALVSANRLNEILNTVPAIADGAGADPDPTARFAVEFDKVSFAYPDANAPVLKEINLQIKRGERLAFIGSTGCGKSTLINLIPRLYDASGGQIRLLGHDIKDYKLNDIRTTVAYIPQKALLFKGTVRENVAFGVTATDDEIWRALEIAQGKDFVEALENKLDYEISQYGENLSGGQKQRIAIARGIVRNPDIFIFDDTFSALDYATDAKLRKALAAAVGDATQIVVAQRIGTIKNMDRIVVLEDGIIVGIGTHKELLKNCKVYEEIALSQLSQGEL